MDFPQHLADFINIRSKTSDIFNVITYTIKASKGKTDDDIYGLYPELIELIPRAFSRVYHNGELITTLRGINKFGGTSEIDEDDAAESSKVDAPNLNTLNPVVEQWAKDDVMKVSFQKKENGKFACFQLFNYNNITYLFGGSKNVHMIYKITDTITGDELQHEIMRKIKTYIDIAGHTNIAHNKTYTAEYVDGKHLEYTNAPYLVFFTDDLPRVFPTVSYLLPDIARMPTNDEMRTIRDMAGIEGCVILYTNTATGQVIRQKHKTKWYVIWRSFREIIKSKKDNYDMKNMYKLLLNRLQARSDMYLHLTPEELEYWKTTALQFLKWLKTSTYKYVDVGPFSNIGLAKILHEFTNNSFALDAALDAPLDNDVAPAVSKPALIEYSLSARQFGLSVVIKGPPDLTQYYPSDNPFRAVILTLNKHDAKKESIPMYYGLFPKTTDIDKIMADMELSSFTKTPFHITVHYVGGSAKLNLAPDAGHLGNKSLIKIIGYSVNIAGSCLLTKHSVLAGNHITIDVNDGFKPAHVGTEITLQNSVIFENPIEIEAMYLPMYA